MPLVDVLGDRDLDPRRKGPLWEGPGGEGPNGGVTFSLLSRFLVCRERFRIAVVEGLRPAESFNHRIEFGSMWHLCEEAHGKKESWVGALFAYGKQLGQTYPMDRSEIAKWVEIVRRMYPVYLDHRQAQRPGIKTYPVFRERVFDVPYNLPSGRRVRLRGKMDGADLVKRGYYLIEHKTKGHIDEERVVRQLNFDLQTMMYAVAFTAVQRLDRNMDDEVPLVGVDYNVIRRPLAGGAGTIVRKKPSKSNPAGESLTDYYDRVVSYVRKEPDRFFMRWRVTFGPDDVARFARECLEPILEQLCDWWEYVSTVSNPFHQNLEYRPGVHWRHPFGVYNVLDEGGSSDLDEYLISGSTAGLSRAKTLFRELEG